MDTLKYANFMRKQASALRQQADALDRQAYFLAKQADDITMGDALGYFDSREILAPINKKEDKAIEERVAQEKAIAARNRAYTKYGLLGAGAGLGALSGGLLGYKLAPKRYRRIAALLSALGGAGALGAAAYGVDRKYGDTISGKLFNA